MPNKKVNPRRVPCTQADVERVKHLAIENTIDLMVTMFCTIMVDKRGCKAEYLKWFGREVTKLSDSIVQGYVSVENLKTVLREEYGFDWRDFA